ncbi:hypothetical protein B0H10DRAFT_1953669 [Mycena sp. CBHHK59/15]|nr:hypothetical protein B0H10DRAFT_1953669 [Mycena sp. CBHHK59/15]
MFITGNSMTVDTAGNYPMHEYFLRCSYLKVYKEPINDLLMPGVKAKVLGRRSWDQVNHRGSARTDNTAESEWFQEYGELELMQAGTGSGSHNMTWKYREITQRTDLDSGKSES